MYFFSTYLQVQHYLESLKVEGDSHSTSSGEGSNADSGRGPSEEGEANHNNAQGILERIGLHQNHHPTNT